MPKRNAKPNKSSSSLDKITLIERIPHVDHFCYFFDLRFGAMFIGISGIVLGCVSFLAYLILIGRSELDMITVLLLLLLALFALVSVMFIIGSVLLVMAACCKSPEFVPAYIWITIIYWITQFVLGIFIPIVLVLEGGRSYFIALVWSCLVMILGLYWMYFGKAIMNTYFRFWRSIYNFVFVLIHWLGVWTHYLAVVKSFMWGLYDDDGDD